ncbi:MAG: site-specific integrase [Gemmataceae bacterium]|nr:site-specific integrase [Gemmataceae bacterium]
MSDPSLLGPWVRRFLLEHLVGERNLARNTQQSYRDALRLLLPFAARRAHKPIDRLGVEDLSTDGIRAFLQEVEEKRGCVVATRNQRLAAIHSLAHFIGLRSPEHIHWCGEVRAIPFKKATRSLVTYLEKKEMDALLAAPDRSTAQGRRDHALLLFLYNTGARADEVAQGCIADLDLGQTPSRDPSSILIHGKGNKLRRCPLWTKTVHELLPLVRGRAPTESVFLNRRGQPLTRFGIHALVERYAETVAATMPSLAGKRVSPHTIRHTTATHLLRAGVDINTIRAWLGHVSLSTTNVYAEVDLEMKAKALANCEVEGVEPQKPWREQEGLMEFLRTL